MTDIKTCQWIYILHFQGQLRKVGNIGERQSIRQDLKHWRKELRTREEGAIKEVLGRADVVMTILTTAAEEGPIRHLPQGHFDLIIIDECSQVISCIYY